jgi:hypothetical protein
MQRFGGDDNSNNNSVNACATAALAYVCVSRTAFWLVVVAAAVTPMLLCAFGCVGGADRDIGRQPTAKQQQQQPLVRCTCRRAWGAVLWCDNVALARCICCCCCRVLPSHRRRWSADDVQTVFEWTAGRCYFCDAALGQVRPRRNRWAREPHGSVRRVQPQQGDAGGERVRSGRRLPPPVPVPRPDRPTHVSSGGYDGRRRPTALPCAPAPRGSGRMKQK